MSNYPERVQGIIGQYIEAFDRAEKNRKPGSGLFGFGQGPGDYPCHDEMDRQVAELAGEAAADETGAEEAAELVRAILQAEKSRVWPEAARLAVLAAQRHTLVLIPRMRKEDRQTLLAWYGEAYPRRKRLPVQNRILKELEK